MKRLKRKNINRHIIDCEDDIKRIVEIFEKRGYILSKEDARFAWENYSESVCAGWLLLDKDDDDVFNNASRGDQLAIPFKLFLSDEAEHYKATE